MATNTSNDEESIVPGGVAESTELGRFSSPEVTSRSQARMIASMCTPRGANVAMQSVDQLEWNRTVPARSRNMGNIHYPHHQRPASALLHSTTPNSSRDLSHRDRLVSLRKRMNVEFGNREIPSSSSQHEEVDDAVSTMSEAPSLHSWHQHMLERHETLIVNASDTMSTCALSVAPSVASDSCDRFKSPLPPASSSHTANDEKSNNDVSSPKPRVPPPIPSREHVISPTKPNRVPPPLPPRSSISRLPNPIVVAVETRMRNCDVRENRSYTDCGANESNGPKCSKSSDFVIEDDNKANVKCHKKSNSLDRGLTLAKSIKSGPFPPPSNKSNSLKRQEADGEENERNVIAENVIQEITTNVQAKTNFLYSTQEEPENEVSLNGSSISSPSSSTTPPKQDLVPLQKVEEQPCSSISQQNETKISENELDTIKNESNDELKSSFEQQFSNSSFDPITLDVERRLSMKRSGKTDDDNISIDLSDDETSRMSVAQSSIGHARSFARHSMRYASGMLRGAIQKVRYKTNTGASTFRSEIGEDSSEYDETETGQHAIGNIVRPRKSKKGPFDFEHLKVDQELGNEHTGAVWCIKFSICGRLMATAGQDAILRLWVVRSHLKYFSDIRDKYAANLETSMDNLNPMDNIDQFRPPSSMESAGNSDSPSEEDSSNLFCSKPFALLKGHTADILDLSWSKNYFILSSGMDRTVKLWHLSRNECLCCFQHIDFVTCVAFLPKDDRYFLSGSLDGKLRLWHIPDKKVAVWNEVQVKFITAITFVKNGKFAVVGTYNGRCYFYTTDQLKYHTVVDVRSTRGRNAKGHKITGLAVHGDKLLVTSNDSRIRMYDIRDKALTCKFRGVQNDHSQIRAAFSPDGRHIVCGSEDKFVYLWRTGEMPSSLSVRKDRNSMWERVRTHNAAVSVAVFAPRPHVFFSMLERRERRSRGESLDYDVVGQSDSINSNGNITMPGHVIVSADLQGVIKIMVNKPKQCKVASSTSFAKSAYST